jgi:hypothetical protein
MLKYAFTGFMWLKRALYQSGQSVKTRSVLSGLQRFVLLLLVSVEGVSCLPLLPRDNLTEQLSGDWLVENPSLQADTVYLVRKSRQAWCVQQEWSFQADQTLSRRTTDHCKSLLWTTTQLYHVQVRQPSQLMLILRRPAANGSPLIQPGPFQGVDTLYFRILPSKAEQLRLVRQDK